jgi:hypothetical protein
MHHTNQPPALHQHQLQNHCQLQQQALLVLWLVLQQQQALLLPGLWVGS